MRRIECLVTGATPQLQGDGCVFEPTADRCTVVPPDRLTSGEYVKILLWLPNEPEAVSINLAEVRWIRGNWLSIEAIQISPRERVKLQDFVRTIQPDLVPSPLQIDEVVVRA